MKNPFGGRILLIRRKYVVALALVLAVTAIFYIINHPAIVGTTARERSLPIYSVQREDAALSLTFNLTTTEDIYTVQVLEVLNAFDVRASFFVTGDWVRENTDLAARLVVSGHELLNLSDDHNLLRRRGGEELATNILACSDAIAEITGARPTVFRAPYGGYDDRVVALVEGLGMHAVQWSVDSGDWRGIEAAAITRQVQNRAFPGAIVLLHAGLEQTALAIPEIVAGLLQEGYLLVPVSELVAPPSLVQ
ncbi:MAG: polysaccharide deacetylase family protein [Oscillospiraceae bacterium]|nr:polysaccharide deacetylase family protein [Oscillospiraceae bacterium]